MIFTKKDNLFLDQGKSSEWDEGIFITLMVMAILIPIVFYPYCIPIFKPAKNLLFRLLFLVGITP